jgi:hypothetical protein
MLFVTLNCLISVTMKCSPDVACKCGPSHKENEGLIYWRSNREKRGNQRDRATFLVHVSQEYQRGGMAQSMR